MSRSRSLRLAWFAGLVALASSTAGCGHSTAARIRRLDQQEQQLRASVASLEAAQHTLRAEVEQARLEADLARKGMPMDRLEDVDHIFPRSRGGLDHPLNYQPLEQSLNRSLGNKLVAKFMQAPLGFVRGMAVSALGVLGGCN